MSTAIFIEHAKGGGAGYLNLLFRDRGIKTKTIQAYKDGIPAVLNADYLILMGSDQEVTKMSWYKEEIQLIQQHLEQHRPVMGVCAGAELIALAMGGKLIQLKHREYGWKPVTSPIGPSWVFEWHEDAFRTPPGAQEIVKGADEGMCQAYRGRGFMGTQFHPEMTAEILGDWTDNDPKVCPTMSPLHPSNADKLLSSQKLARYLVDQFIGMKCTCGAHKAHIVARPFGGANKTTNRLEFLMVRVMQDALDAVARDLDIEAGSVRGVLGNFETRRNLALGLAFRVRVHHVLEQIAQEATRNAEILLTKARAKQGKPIGAKIKKKTVPSVPLLPTGPSLTQQMTPWKDLVNGITDHVVQSTDRIADDLKDRLTTTLKEGYSNGEGARDLGKRVQDALSVDKSRAEAKARTLTMETYNQAHLVQYQQAGATGYTILVAEDERTCDYCSDLDGTTFSFDDPGALHPPFHDRCRCTETAELDDLPDDAGEVSDDTRTFCENWRDKYLDIPLYAK